MKVAVDSSVLVYVYARAAAAKKDRALTNEAAQLLESPHNISIPAPALAEILAGLEPKVRVGLEEVLSHRFEILSFDRQAAAIAGSLAGHIKQRGSVPKQAAKVDHMVAACAIRWEMEALCAHDGDFAGPIARTGYELRVVKPHELLGEMGPLLPMEMPRRS